MLANTKIVHANGRPMFALLVNWHYYRKVANHVVCLIRFTGFTNQ